MNFYIEALINNLLNTESHFKDLETITTPVQTTINIYPTRAPLEILVQKNPNITYIDLGDCEDKLKSEYNLFQIQNFIFWELIPKMKMEIQLLIISIMKYIFKMELK